MEDTIGIRFDSTRRAKFLDLMRAGGSQESAAQAVGVSRQTIANWARIGRTETATARANFAAQLDSIGGVSPVAALAPMNRPLATPSHLTQEISADIVQALLTGCYRETAAQRAGVSALTLQQWLERGASDYKCEAKSVYSDLLQAITTAEANAELQSLAVIRQASTRSWQAAAWLLERKHPSRWSRDPAGVNARADAAYQKGVNDGSDEVQADPLAFIDELKTKRENRAA